MGKEVELILYEDEGHAFLKRAKHIGFEIRRMEFLAKYLERLIQTEAGMFHLSVLDTHEIESIIRPACAS